MATKKDLSFLTQSKTSRVEAAANEKAKREAELQEMRRLRAEAGGSGVNWDNGSAPITDLEAWRNSQKNASEEERRKKMEAAQGLHGYRGKDVPEGKKKGRDSKVFKPWEGKGGSEGEEADESEVHEEESGGVNVHEMAGKFENVSTNEQKEADDMRDDEAGESVEQAEEPVVETEGVVEHTPVPEPEEEPENKKEEPPVPEPEIATPPPVEEPAPVVEAPIPQPEPEPVVEQPPEPVLPPTYSRTDVKFSFGLIVRSNHPTGTFANENLRDNETLRKCMASTSKILIKEMPSPPSIAEDEYVDYSTFPQAYYDPTLEPTVLSIEEDEKNTTVMMEKGNKRTLVKASFPVFLIQDGESGEKNKALLKETKSTVFKALRAAVSGGQFLR